MKHRQNLVLALLACASLAGPSVFAALPLNYYTGAAGGDWMTSSNWSANELPSSSNCPVITSGSSVILSGANLDLVGITLSVGAFTSSSAVGSGTLTIAGSTATFGYLNMARPSAAVASSGVASIYLNNSSVTFAATANVGYGNGLADSQTAILTVDETSSLYGMSGSTGQLFQVGRGTTGTLALLGNATSGGQATVGRLIAGVDTGGVGYVIMGTNSKIVATGSVSVNTGSFLSMSGATLIAGDGSLPGSASSLIATTGGTIVGTNSTISAYNNVIVGAGSTISLTGTTLSAGATGGTGNFTSSEGGTILLTNSRLAISGNFVATASAVSTLGTSLTLTGSSMTANSFSLGMTTSNATTAGRMNYLTMTNSSLQVLGDATLTFAAMAIENSTLTIGGRLRSQVGSVWNTINNSTISAATLEFSYTANSATISNTVITLSTTSVIAPISSSGYSAALYLTDGSSIYVGTNGVLGAGNVYLGANSTTASLTAVGGIIRTNSLTSTNSAVNLSNTTYTLGGNLSATNSAIALTNSTILISTASSLSGASLGMNSSSISVAGAFNATNGVAISLVNSTLSIGTSLTSGIVATSAGGTSINATGSTISVGTIVFSGVSSASSSFRHAVNLTNSSLQVATLASLGYAPLTMYNSTLTVGTNIFLQSDSANTIQNSTVSSGGFEGNFSSNTISMIGSVMTLSSTVSVTPVLSSRTSTTRMYVKDSSSIAVGDNGYFCVGYVYLGSSGIASLSMTGGSTSISTAIYVGAASGGTGYLSVTGGTATIAKTLSVGVSGAGTVSVSGTGVLYSPVLVMSGNATLAGNVYIQGTQATPVTAAGQATFDTMRLGSGAVLTGGTVHINPTASISLILSGTPDTFQSVKIQSLAFDGASTINVDFTNIAITEATEIVILLADTVSGLEYNPPITTVGLDSAWQALYEGRTIGGQTALVAVISAVPEPALSALFAGGLGLWLAIRRRRR